MKNTFSQIVSFSLAALVLLSTFSFTIEKHYCMGELANYAILGNAEGCEMPMSDQEMPVFNKVPCCNDIVELVEGTNTELKTSSELATSLEFVAVYFTSYTNLFKELPNEQLNLRNHSPPLLSKDRQILYETFLI